MTKRPASTQRKLVTFVVRHNGFYKQKITGATVVPRSGTRIQVLHLGLPVARSVILGRTARLWAKGSSSKHDVLSWLVTEEVPVTPHLLGDRSGGPSSCPGSRGFVIKKDAPTASPSQSQSRPSWHQLCPLIRDLTPAGPLTQPHRHRKGQEEPWWCPGLTRSWSSPFPAHRHRHLGGGVIPRASYQVRTLERGSVWT